MCQPRAGATLPRAFRKRFTTTPSFSSSPTRASSPTRRRIGSKRASRTNSRIVCEKSELKAKRCTAGLPSMRPQKTGTPFTKRRFSSSQSRSIRRSASSISAISSALATRLEDEESVRVEEGRLLGRDLGPETEARGERRQAGAGSQVGSKRLWPSWLESLPTLPTSSLARKASSEARSSGVLARNRSPVCVRPSTMPRAG